METSFLDYSNSLDYQKYLSKFEQPINYIGLFGVNGDYEMLAGGTLPANSHLIIYIDDHCSYDRLLEFYQLCNYRNHSIKVLDSCITKADFNSYLKHSFTLLHLDPFTLSEVGGLEGVQKLYNSLPQPKELRCIVYNRGLGLTEKIKRIREGCKGKITSISSSTRRYSRYGVAPQYFVLEND